MKFECHHLFDALDRTGGRPELDADLLDHLRSCAACREEAELWRAVLEEAPKLRKEWESPELWKRIEAELTPPSRAGRVRVGRFGTSSANWMAIAATLFLLLVSGAVLWLFLASDAPSGSLAKSKGDPLLTEKALDRVEEAEQAYVKSIEDLSKLVEPSVLAAETPLMINYRERLRLIDEAIRECRARLESNRYNAHLRSELLSVYQEKQRTLMELLREDRRDSH